MNSTMMRAFQESVSGELKKEAGIGDVFKKAKNFIGKHQTGLKAGAEIAGLGVLAKPSIDEWRGKKVEEKKKSKYELAGLGMLAAPSAIELAHHIATHR